MTETWPSPALIWLAHHAALESALRPYPSRTAQAKRDDAIAIALGVLHMTVGDPDKRASSNHGS